MDSVSVLPSVVMESLQSALMAVMNSTAVSICYIANACPYMPLHAGSVSGHR